MKVVAERVMGGLGLELADLDSIMSEVYIAVNGTDDFSTLIQRVAAMYGQSDEYKKATLAGYVLAIALGNRT